MSLFLYPTNLYLTVAVATVIALLLGPAAILLARRIGLIDMPGSAAHKQHHKPTPLAGGIVLAVSLGVLVFPFGFWQDARLRAILIASVVILAFGLWDDLYGLGALLKFVGQFLAVIVLIAAGFSVRILGNFQLPINRELIVYLNYGLTFFWLIGITNAFNLIDSMDGLVAGLAMIMLVFLALGAQVSGQVYLAVFSATLLGICIGLYFYNASPARLFLGDAGAQTLGFMLASITLVYNPLDFPQGSSWFLPILLLGIPIFDTSLVVISRLRRGEPVFTGNLDHTYHRLRYLGLENFRAVLVIHLASFLLGCVGFIALQTPPWLANLIFLSMVLLGIGALVYLEREFAQRTDQ